MQTNKRNTIAVILAAGKGTRMKSDLPKVLHPLLGKPLIHYVTKAVMDAGVDDIYLIIGYKAELVKNSLGNKYHYVEQKQQLGTGHALMMAAEQLKNFAGDVLVLVGDAPFLTPVVIKNLIDKHQKEGASCTMMTAIIDPPPPYGRIVRDNGGNVVRIVEDRDATEEQKRITEVNTSHYCFRSEDVFPLLGKIENNNDQEEYYLTDIVELLTKNKFPVITIPEDDPDILKGINSQEDLRTSVKKLKNDVINFHMSNGVLFPYPDLVYIETDIKIGKHTIIHPFSYISGKTTIGTSCEIGPFVTIKNAAIGNNCHINNKSVIDEIANDDMQT